MGFLEDLFGADASDKAAALYKEAAGRWDNIENLSPEDLARKAQSLYDSGMLTPEEYSAVQQDPSSLMSYAPDAKARGAQMSSLDYLTNLGNEGGLDAQARSRLNYVQNKNATEARGARDANRMRSAQRGMGGSGMEAVQNMIANQGAATSNFLGGTDVAAEAERRALDAMTNAGTLGGSIRTQDFNEADRKAQAADAINRFNAANKTDANRINVEARNKSRDAARGMYDDKFNRDVRQTAGWTNAYTGAAPYVERAGQQRGKGLEGIGESVAGGAGGFMMSDINAKKNINASGSDLDEFLDNLRPKKWEYKEPEKYGAGKKYGVMAQDMEKSPVGASMVEEDSDGVKRIDYGSAQGVMLSILKDLSDRVGRMEGGNG